MTEYTMQWFISVGRNVGEDSDRFAGAGRKKRGNFTANNWMKVCIFAKILTV
jgi:hypothetical protein